MGLRDYLQLALFVGILLSITKPLGIYLDDVFDGTRTFLSPVLGPFESLIYRLLGVDPREDQHWTRYSSHLLVFSAVGCAFTYAILRLQQYLPLNPAGMGVISPHLAFNTAMSFTTNTNWQSYGGESTMSYLSQMVALAFHNFTSAASGIIVAIALIRGIARKEARGIGNFWADLVRCHLYVLLPICLVYAVFLVSQGMIQNFNAYTDVTTLEGIKQTIAQGPVASQVAIKMLGTNGGGFFNANAAHPFENPTALSNFLQMLSIFAIPSALVYMLGRKVKNTRHGWAVWTAMAVLFLAGVFMCAHYEYQGNPAYTQLGCASPANWEGKEARFGIFNSSLFATITTDASCGAVNAMHDSFTPLGGFVPLVNIMLSEIIFGGVGSGLYGMLGYVILTVFIAGLMVGRTPEYLGKKIEGREIKYIMFSMIVFALLRPGFRGVGLARSQRPGGVRKPRGPRIFGDPLCLHVRERKQRQRVRRPERQHAVLESHARVRDVLRALLHDDPDARGRRIAGAQENSSGRGGDLPGRRAAFRRAADRRDLARRRADVLPGSLARARSPSTSTCFKGISLSKDVRN